MRKIMLAISLSLAIAAIALAEGPVVPQAAATPTATARKKIDNDFVQQQFGDQFTYLPQFGTAVGDLDGDGVEDVIIAARCKNPMIDQDQYNFRVIDPMNSFYGYGDPRLTTTFSEGDPSLRGLVVLIIHGAGPEAWWSAKPKAKFVLVNLPYRSISVKRFRLKKRMADAIYLEEAGEMGETSAVFFDGKKFQYVPMGGDMQ